MRAKPQWLLGLAFLVGLTAFVYGLTEAVAQWPWNEYARERNGSNLSALERYRQGFDRQGQARKARERPMPPSPPGPFKPLPPEPDYTGRWKRW